MKLAAMICVGLALLSLEARAQFSDAKLDKEAWACAGAYAAFPRKVLNAKNREQAICIGEGKRKPMSHAVAFERCRKQFSAKSLLVRWTRGGWLCRYYGL